MNVKVVAVFQGQYSSWNPMHDIEVLYLRDSNELMMIANANCEYPNHYDLNDEWYDPICELAEDLNHMASITEVRFGYYDLLEALVRNEYEYFDDEELEDDMLFQAIKKFYAQYRDINITRTWLGMYK